MIKLDKMFNDLRKTRIGKNKTFRMARDFCALQVVLMGICIYCVFNRLVEIAMLCILVEFLEWRFFSLSMRLRRGEEEREERQALKEKKHNA